MKRSSLYILFFLTSVLLLSCSEDTPGPGNPVEGLTRIAVSELAEQSYVLEVYSATPILTASYTPIYVRVLDKEQQAVKLSDIRIIPEMTMHMDGHEMQHSAPVSAVTASQQAGLYEAAVVFTMAGTETDKWVLNIDVKTPHFAETLRVPLEVKETPQPRIKSVKTESGAVYLLAYIAPKEPEIGVNDFEFAIYQTVDKDNYLPVDDLQVSMRPEMPSMGHGSPNNLDPVSIGQGLYQGKVNFTMSGDWRIHLELQQDTEVLRTYFDLVF